MTKPRPNSERNSSEITDWGVVGAWLGRDLKVWAWYGCGMGVVWAWYGRDLKVWAWYGCGMGVVWV
jgi:hypothetical protein